MTASLKLVWLGLALAVALGGCERPTQVVEKAANIALRDGKAKREPGQPKPYHGDLPSMAAINVRDVVLDEVTASLEFPWAMEFLSSEEVLVNEFEGRLVRVSLPDGKLEYISGLPDIPPRKGQVGLMDLVLHPDHATNGLLYFSHAIVEQRDGSNVYATAVSRARLVGDTLEDVRQIFNTHPFVGQTSNFGGALVFDDNNYLYIGTGDRGRSHRAQQTLELNGMIVRLDDAGNIPADNPFVGNPAVDDRIYAMGVRNPQGLVRDSLTGTIYETEHGPMGGDEVNIIKPGRNYGWPVITYGYNYGNQRVGLGTSLQGMEQPLFYYLPSLATSPIELYRGEMFPEWEGDLFVGLLKGKAVTRLDLVGDRVISMQSILNEVKSRVRDIKVAADGSLYILTQSGRLLRLHRAAGGDDLDPPEDRKGIQVYRTVCSSCHGSGQEGVPQLVDLPAWKERLAAGKEQWYRHTLEGYGAMPPRGLCETCSDKEIRLAVDLMYKVTRRGLKQLEAEK